MSNGQVTGRALLGIDVGGTFTDAVLVAGGELHRAKVPTTADQAVGVIEAALRVLESSSVAPGDVSYFAHGMTTATNALLERKGVDTASVTTGGFRDILEIGRQNRPRLYEACPQRPSPLVPGELRFTASERVGPKGILEVQRQDDISGLVAAIRDAAPDAVAVCLLFSFLHPSHERELGERLRREFPGLHVSLSSDVLPRFREYERFSTTAVDAYLTPLVERYLRGLEEKASDTGLPAPNIMQSSGGVLPLKQAEASAAPLLLSGPAAGVVGAVFSGEREGAPDIIAFDMGGTSTDVSLVDAGAIATTSETEIGGCPVALPMIDIHTIGAGGGSIAWIDAGGALRVGPQSAGAQPGPACYGNGGDQATVTDANLCLGYLGESLGGAGGLALETGAAQAVVGELAEELGMERELAATGIRRVANAGMVKALRVISIERGYDPRGFALVAFGGAGPMHAADLAVELGITRVMVPDSCGVLSALGMVVGDRRRDWIRTVFTAGGWDETRLERDYGELEEEALKDMPSAALLRQADMRYAGQSHELTVEVEKPLRREQAIRAFESEHEKAYGYKAEGEQVELVNIRLIATITLEKPRLAAGVNASGSPARRQAWFEGTWRDVEVWQRRDMGDARVRGPAVIEEDEATTVVPPGWVAAMGPGGNLWLEAD